MAAEVATAAPPATADTGPGGAMHTVSNAYLVIKGVSSPGVLKLASVGRPAKRAP